MGQKPVLGVVSATPIGVVSATPLGVVSATPIGVVSATPIGAPATPEVPPPVVPDAAAERVAAIDRSRADYEAAVARVRGGETRATERPPPVRVPEARPSPFTPPSFAGITAGSSTRNAPTPTDIALPAPPRAAAAPLPPATRISPEGLATLKDREGGFYDTPYQDSGGLAIGYGMQTWKGKRVTKDLRITQADGDAEFARQVEHTYTPIVRSALTVPVTQAQFDALVSLAYNSPAAAVNLAKKLNAGETLTAADFAASGTVDGKPHPGLQTRRGEEYTQFTTPPAPPPAVVSATPLPRPPPVDLNDLGTTDPTSVRVTETPRAPLPLGRMTGLVPPALAAQRPTGGPLVEGAQQFAKGATALGHELAHPAVLPTDAHVLPASTPGADVAMESAVADLVEGIFKLSTPLIVAGAVQAPLRTAWAVTKAVLAAKVGEKGAEAIGATKEGQRLTGDVAALLSGTIDATAIATRIAESAGAVARPYVLAAKLAGETVGTARNPGARAAGTIAEAAAPLARPAPNAVPEIVQRGVDTGDAIANPETLTDIVKTVRAPEPPPLQVGGPNRSAILDEYHAARLAALKAGQEPPTYVAFVQARDAARTESPAPIGVVSATPLPAAPATQPYRKEVVHVTTPEGAEGILADGFDVHRGQGETTPGLGGDHYGPGVYLADYQRDMASFWRGELETKNFEGTVETEALRGDVSLERPFHYEYNRYSNSGQITGRIAPRQAVEQQRPDLVAAYDAARDQGQSERRALGQVLRDAGYDGLVIEHRAGDEIVAFDAKAVTWTHRDNRPIEAQAALSTTAPPTIVSATPVPAPTDEEPADIREIRERLVRQSMAAFGVADAKPGEAMVTQAEVDRLREYDEQHRASASTKKPVTPQLPPAAPGSYVLAPFATAQYVKPKDAVVLTTTWMNEGEIDEAVERMKDHPILGPAARFLEAFKDETNRHSDGWHSWKLPGHAAGKLQALLHGYLRAGMGAYPLLPEPTAADVRATLGPIKAFMTKRGTAAGMTLPELALPTDAKTPAAPAILQPKAEPISPKVPRTDPTVLAQAVAAARVFTTVEGDAGKFRPVTDSQRQHIINNLTDSSDVPYVKKTAWHIEKIGLSKRGGKSVVALTVRTYAKKTGKPEGKEAQTYRFEVPADFDLNAHASTPAPKPDGPTVIPGLTQVAISPGAAADAFEPGDRVTRKGKDAVVLDPARKGDLLRIRVDGEGFERHVDARTVERVEQPAAPLAAADAEPLQPSAEGTKVEAPDDTDERPVAGGQPAGTRDADQPTGGDRGAGPEGVAGEQPDAAPPVSQQPAQSARAGKRGTKRRGAAARRGADSESGGTDAGTSEGLDDAGHVDTADVADTQDESDAHARGEAPRWFSITDAATLTDGGWTRKLEDNLAALRLLKQLDREGRPATDAEQAVLARYIGWGHTELAAVVDLEGVDHIRDPRKVQARQELEQLLTPAELKELGESTANAHYSFSDLPRAMWALAQRLGFKGGSVLEPAVGTGHFLGTMPGPIRAQRRTKVYAVDKEPVAAAIARQLYQGAHVQASPLEDAVLPDNYFDLAISNVPFGKIGVFDPAFVSAEKTPLTRNIHNYFFAKAIDVVRPGGLLVLVTSRYTMDSQDDTARRYFDKYADFIGAFRLPDQAFKKTAGTEVVTDVIVLQKREPQAPGRKTKPAWLSATKRDDLGKAWDGTKDTWVHTNEYFVAHPEMVLGTEDRSGKMNRAGNQYNVTGTVTPEQLAAAVAAFPANLFKPAKLPPRKIASAAQKDAKQGAYVLEHGKLYTYDKATLTPSPLKGLSLDRAKAFVPLRDAYLAVIDTMINQASDAELLTAQKALAVSYGAFVKRFGHLNLRENKRIIDGDAPNASRVLALENIDIIKGAKGKPSTIVVTGLADVFTKRLMRPPAEPTAAASPSDALLHSIAWKGRVDLEYMEGLTGQPAAALAQALTDEIFQDVSTQAWVPRDEYLSGDVVTKLAQAQAAVKVDPRFAANVAALTAVQPTPLTVDDFTGDPKIARSAPFGATWVPVPLIERFLHENGGPQATVRLLNTKSKVAWYVEGYGRHEYLQAGYDYAPWVAEALNGEIPTIYGKDDKGNKVVDPEATERYRQSLGQLKEQWATWWKSHPDTAEAIVGIYNAMFNREVNRLFDGSRLVTPNSNPEIVLRPGQKDSVVGALQRGNTLLAQAVGWGKTFEMIAIVGEWKRLGFANKPIIVVPNHIVEQWRRAFLAFYPAARVLLPEKRDYETGNRKRLIARIANNDWDAVVVGMSQFLKVGVRLDTLRTFITEQEDQLLAEGAAELGISVADFSSAVDGYGRDEKDAKQIIGGRGVPRSVKDVARAILNLRKRLKKRTDQQSKDPINFEDLGVDGLVVDEAHMVKNLYFYTSKNDIVGLKGSDADIALDMYLKVRHINQTSNNRNVLFATGTPITNTMSELYTMFRYLAQPQLDRLGMAGFDSWANAYAEAVGSKEPAPEGGYKERTRLAQWTNLAELSRMFRRFADVVTTEDILKENARLEALGEPPLLKLPSVKKVTIQLEPHPEFDAFMADLRSRIEAVRKGKPGVIGHNPKTGKDILDNFLTVTTAAGLAAVDMRLVRRGAADDPNGRLQVAAREIATRYQASADTKGVQLVFLDVGVPKGTDIPPLPSSIAAPTSPEDVGDDEEDDTSPDLVDAEAEAETELDGIRAVGFDRNLYGELKRLLVAKGIKPDEVAFIHQATNPSEQKRLFDAVNAGRIRVLMSTRAKGGTGMNVQKKVIALHHLDVPWRPDQMEQAEGRAVRQGNEHDAVEIVRYVTKKSFDEYRWYLLAKKQGFIASFYRGDVSNLEDIDTTQLDMQVASALASGDPRTMQMIQAERALVGLQARYENFSRRRGQAERDLRAAEKSLAHGKAALPKIDALAKAAAEWRQKPLVVVDTKPGRYYGVDEAPARTFDLRDTDSRKALRDALIPLLAIDHLTNERIASAGPFRILRNTVETEIRFEIDDKGRSTKIDGRQAAVLTIEVTAEQDWIIGTTPTWDPANPGDIVRLLDNRLEASWPVAHAASLRQRDANAEREVVAAKRILEKQFEQHDELAAKQKEVTDLRIALGVEKAVASAAKPTTDADAGDVSETSETPERAHDMRAPATLQAATAGLKAAHDEIRQTLAAPSITEGAKLSSRYLRLRIAQMMHTMAVANHRLKDYRNAVEAATVDHATILDYADAIEGVPGAPPLPAWLQAWVPLRTEIYDYLKKQIADLGIEKQWRAYYLGHVWETEYKDTDPKPGILARLIGRRPLQGPKTFLKKRSIPTMREGVERWGKEPKTWNLVDIDLYKMQEMAKFILGRQALEDNKALGTWVFVTALKKAPDGMLPIPDAIGQVWAPPEITVSEAYDQLLMEGLENFVRGLGVRYDRKTWSGSSWGRTGAETGDITMRVGSPEFALMHEIGHALDTLFGLYDRIATTIKTPEFEGDKSALGELKKLAELRYQGQNVTGPEGERFKRYVQTHAEQIANLVHGYLYTPELTRQTAPRAYDALDELVLTQPDLAPLADLQQMRSLVIGSRDATHKLPGPMLLGRYYASPAVVRIFTNYLTPGLSANKLWALVRIPANALVQAKLSFSAFHAFTVTQEAAALEGARGLTDVLRGRPVRGLRKVAKAFVEPVAVIRRGRAIKREYLGTLDPLTLAADAATNLLLAGGGRIEQSREFTNRSLQKFADSLRRANGAFVRSQHGRAGSEVLGAALHLLPALVEAASYPIMQMLVPTVKTGATTANIRAELAHLPGVPTERTLLAIASKAVNLSDATLGEVIWDNYFLPRALMSAVHMVIMAPGWRGGSAVILARGVTDPVRKLLPGQRETYQVRVPVTGGGGSSQPPTPPGAPGTPPAAPLTTLVDVKERYWSPYTSLMIATVLLQVLVSELYQQAHGAGHVLSPRDVAFPRDGEVDANGTPTRVRIPGYAGIFFDILHDVPRSILEYALGGTAPMPTAIGQLYHDETTFGEQIVDHTDPWRVQLTDYAKFLGTQFEPISVSSYGRRAGTPLEKAESVIGISPAPARVTRSPLETYLHDLLPPLHRTKDEAAKATARREVRTDLRAGDTAGARTAAREGGLSRQSYAALLRSQHREPVRASYDRTTLAQAVRAYTLATPEERRLLRPAFNRKAATLMAGVPPDKRAALRAEIAAARQLPVAAGVP